MKVRCAWHGEIISEKPPYGGKYDEMVTDGICLDCEKKYFGKEIKNGRKNKGTKETASQDTEAGK